MRNDRQPRDEEGNCRISAQGTVVAAEKATDNRSLVRVPFSQIIPTAIKVVDTSNQGFSGAGWEVTRTPAD